MPGKVLQTIWGKIILESKIFLLKILKKRGSGHYIFYFFPLNYVKKYVLQDLLYNLHLALRNKNILLPLNKIFSIPFHTNIH